MIAARVLGFSLLLILFFTLLPHLLPQIEGEAPQEIRIDSAGLTMEAFIDLGRKVFEGKGACALCHKPAPLGRAPDLLALDVETLTAQRLADPAYRGEAQDSAGYLLESMREPNRFVAPGWGLKGSGGEISPMPAAHKPPVGLAPWEMDAIIAFLQAKDGHPVTVSLP
jgi:mono/diheme cytochrome c family protein